MKVGSLMIRGLQRRAWTQRGDVRRRLLGVLAVLVLPGLVLLVGAAPAGAAQSGAWWSLNQVAVPSHVSVARETGEVQEVVATEEAIPEIELFTGEPGYEGVAFELSVGGKPVLVGGKPVSFADEKLALFLGLLGFEGIETLSSGNLQAALEGAYGAGNVEVSEIAGAPTGTSKFAVKTAGADVGTSVAAITLEQNAYREEDGKLWGKVAASVTAPAVPAGEVLVRAVDAGDGPIEGKGAAGPVVIKDTLPAGLEAVGVSGTVNGWYLKEGRSENFHHGVVTCDLTSATTVTCEYAEEAGDFSTVEAVVDVIVEKGAASGDNKVTVAGGGAPPASHSQLVTVSEAAVPFGVEPGTYLFAPEAEGGVAASQAGAHPFQVTTTFALNNTGEGTLQPAQPRDQTFDLPAGLVGNAQATAQCTLTAFVTQVGEGDACPAQSAIGVAVIWLSDSIGGEVLTDPVPVFNLVPGVGEPARFGVFPGAPVLIDTSLRSGSDYGVVASVHNLAQGIGVLGTSLTLWGAPGAAAHDSTRGWRCLELSDECASHTEQAQTSLLSMPSACEELNAPFTLNSWTDEEFLPVTDPVSTFSLNGCNHEQFEPQLEVQPTSVKADSPTGVNVHLSVPQEAGEQPAAVSEADVRNTTVTLPAGVQINPAAAAGLTGCSEEEIGYEAKRSEDEGRPAFKEEGEAERLGEVPYEHECPESSRIGKVSVQTRLLPKPLTGYVYQAAQDANPFGSLLALYVVAEDKQAGVRVRLAGEVKVQSDGQLVSTFAQTPQVPFEEFTLEFFSGGKAPLATTGCGEYKTTSEIEPWSSGAAGEILVKPSSLFDVSSGPGESSCSSVGGFAPTFSAGTVNNDAGAFSPLIVRLKRGDGEQTLSTVSMTMPPGLAGIIADVEPCAEAQANAGDCPAASKIGHVRVTAGVGTEPIVLPEAGKGEDPVYLTGPYKNAPFGLSIVVPAEAGPFNLDENGHPIVVRGTINVDPHTAQVSIHSEPVPTRLQGIPTDVREVEVVINKAGFTFNPTNCEAMNITGTIGSSEGASEAVSSHFDAADCATLPFKPTLKVSTHKGHTRRNGAYLKVQVGSGSGQANLKSVRVELPKILPSRESTLKQSCTEKQFAENPSGCPEGSRVGTATVRTPVLPVPLTGPAIFVSHGGAAFPDLDLVLQGDGVTIEQTGSTTIAKGVTISDFASIPDVPVSSVELTLPESSHSALTATANLCTQTVNKRIKTKVHGHTIYHKRTIEKKRVLEMPTMITGQNGAQIKETTIVNVEGCDKAKTNKAKKTA